ncbi:MAG: DUF11 domain-containing protein [Cytophagaceae bacterium]|nr:MAG: DUF11 domain-containing protein [Cytophagaceae bacterium]
MKGTMMKYINPQKLNTIVTSIPKRTSVFVAIAAAVVATGGMAFAYGPERPTFTIEKPADHVTFNSITNNPNYGDERNFTLIKDASITGAGGWKDEINVENGKEYIVRMYVHNNAASNLNKVATNTRVMANVPNATGNKVQIDGFVSADNATPQKIWDSVVMTSDKKFNVAYVNGSSQYFNNKFPGGQPLGDSVVTSAGALVGYEKLDGKVPGCFEYSGIATFKVKVNMPSPDFSVEKKVRLNGTTEWQKSVTAKPSQKVDYQVTYKNTGTSTQNDVIAQDTLPKGVSYNNNTTTLRNAANSNGNGLGLTNNELTTKGVNIGNYAPTAAAYVRFTATLPANDALEVCGPNKLINTATVHTTNGQKSDTAEVIVNKDNCTPTTPVTPTELPTTGPAEVVAGLIGVAAITIGVVYYVKSRRELQDTLHAAQNQPTITKSSHK